MERIVGDGHLSPDRRASGRGSQSHVSGDAQIGLPAQRAFDRQRARDQAIPRQGLAAVIDRHRAFGFHSADLPPYLEAGESPDDALAVETAAEQSERHATHGDIVIAHRDGCHAAFYRKRGYEVVGIIDGYPSGHQKIYLKKRLSDR